VVASEGAIRKVDTVDTALLSNSTTLQLASESLTKTQVSHFVFQNVQSGPLVLADIAGAVKRDGTVLVTGVLNHTGGDVGQLQGGKAVIRLEVMQGVGGIQGRSLVCPCKEYTCWVRRGEPETIQLYMNCGLFNSIEDVEQLRLFVEYHPSR